MAIALRTRMLMASAMTKTTAWAPRRLQRVQRTRRDLRVWMLRHSSRRLRLRGNQLDALEVCGGDCAADADADGICDDEDPCVGEFDECGVCNGPGEIYECGCSTSPGDCDCEGNQLMPSMFAVVIVLRTPMQMAL